MDLTVWPFTISMGFVICLGILTNCLSLIYIKFKLQINPKVEQLLTYDTVWKIMLLSLSLVFYILTITFGTRDFYSCSNLLLPLVASYMGSFVFPLAISMIRYHMATQMAKQQHFQQWYMNAITRTSIGILITLCLIMLWTVYHLEVPFGPSIVICSNADNRSESGMAISEDQSFPGALLIFSIEIPCLVMGIIFDIGMYRFLKKRKASVQPQVAMIAWGSNEPPLVSPGSKDSFNSTIPIQATCLGTFSMILACLTTLAIIFQFDYQIKMHVVFSSSIVAYDVMHMPLVLFLTVKSNEKKARNHSTNILPPQGLHFHDNISAL